MRNTIIAFVLLMMPLFESVGQNSIQSKLSLTNSIPEVSNQITFGISKDATEGRDDALGERDYPGPPPSGVHLFIFIDIPDPVERLMSYVNMRPVPVDYSKPLSFKFKIYNNYGNNYTLNWDKLPASIDSAILWDDNFNDLVVVNMKDSTHAYVMGDLANLERYEIRVWYHDGSIGVVDQNNPNDIDLYPNPSSDILNFSGDQSFANYQIVSLIGKVLLKGEFHGVGSSIDISALPAGLYFAKLYRGNGSVLNKRFIKN